MTVKKTLKFIVQYYPVVLALGFFLASLGYYLRVGHQEKVIAVAKEDTARNAQIFCADPKNIIINKETCYAKFFQKLSYDKGPAVAFTGLYSLQKEDPNTLGCHLIAHGIGWGAYTRNPENWRQSIRDMDTSCSYGAVHGVLEGYVGSLPNQTLPKEIIPTICGEEPEADCNHIIG